MITVAFNRGRKTFLFTETLREDTQVNFRNDCRRRNGKEQKRGRGRGKREKGREKRIKGRRGKGRGSMIQVFEKSRTPQPYLSLRGIANSETALNKAD